MAFDRQYLTNLFNSSDGRTRWLYRHPTDLLGAIQGDQNYFDGATDIIKSGDVLVIESLDGTAETFIESSTSSSGRIVFDVTPWTQGFAGSGGSINLSSTQNASSVIISPSGGGTPATIAVGTATTAGVISPSQALQLANLGTAASLNAGAGVNEVLQLDALGRIPAVDGSLLLNLPGGGGGVTSVVGQVGAISAAQLVVAIDGEANTNFLTDTERSKLTGIETSATADQTGAEIKALYEAEANTNAFTDAEQGKLAGVEASATADQTDAEIETAYNNQVVQVSTGERTAGTETAIRRYSPADIASMAATHGGGGGGAITWQDEGGGVGTFNTVNVVGTGASIADAGGGVGTLNVPGAASTGGLYAGWEIIPSGLPPATLAATLPAAVVTARANQTGVLLLGGTHDATQTPTIALGGQTVRIRGEGLANTIVLLPGTNKTFNTALFEATGSVDIAELTFQNGAMGVSVPSSLNNRINDIRMENVVGVGCGAVFRYDTQNAQTGASFGRLQFKNIEAFDVASGLHFLCGNPTSATGHIAHPDEIILRNIKVVGYSHFACAFFSTDPPINGAFPTGYDGYCDARNIHVENGLGTDASLQVGYSIVLHAVKRVYLDGFFVKRIQPGVLIRMMGPYNKAPYCTFRNGTVIDAGSEGGQGGGGISLKGDDLGNVAQDILVENCTIELDTLQFNHAIWIQCANARCINNFIRGDWIFAPFGCQQSTEHANVSLIGNFVDATSATFGANDEACIQLSGHFDFARIENNTAFVRVGNAHGVRLRTGAGGGQSAIQGIIKNNVVHQLGGGNGRAFTMDERSGNDMTGLRVENNVNNGFTTDIDTASITSTVPTVRFNSWQ